MWLQNSCHPSVILHNLIEKKSWDKVQSGHTQSELKSNQELAKYLVFVWPGYELLWESFIWLKLAGGRVGKVEVGFVFSNSIVLHAAGESEIPEVSCVMHKKTANDREQNNNTGARWGRDLGWRDLARPWGRAKRVKLGLGGKKWLQQSGRGFQLLPGLRVSSKPKESRSFVLVVNNKFSGPAPDWRSVWRRKISSAITTEEMDYLYKIMKLFLYMSIISPKRDVISEGFFLLLLFFIRSSAGSVPPWKCLRHVENLHPVMLIRSD